MLPLKPDSRLAAFVEQLHFTVFELNIVDFTFYAAYALLDSFAVADRVYLLNKLLGIWILCECVAEVVLAFERVRLYNKANSNRLAVFQLLHVEANMKDQDSFKLLSVRLLNWSFKLKLVVYCVLIVGLQSNGLLCIVLLTAVSLLSACHLLYVGLRYRPFESSLIAVQTILLELGTLAFFLANFIKTFQRVADTAASPAGNARFVADLAIIGCLGLCLVV